MKTALPITLILAAVAVNGAGLGLSLCYGDAPSLTLFCAGLALAVASVVFARRTGS